MNFSEYIRMCVARHEPVVRPGGDPVAIRWLPGGSLTAQRLDRFGRAPPGPTIVVGLAGGYLPAAPGICLRRRVSACGAVGRVKA